MPYRLAADIGGTFTDLVLLDDDGNLDVHKTPSTPRDFTHGVLTGADEIVSSVLGSGRLESVDLFVHGATVVLNALLQGGLPQTGLVTTAGFRDVLEIMRTNNPRMYDLQYVKPAPAVPRWARVEVVERMRHTGEVWTPLDEESVARAVEALRAANVEAVAVCLLHAYANPTHERRVGELLARALPGVTVCLSSDVAPEWREFERTSTTCVNAATVPIIRSYLDDLSSQLRDRGLRRELLVMQSNGGVMSTSDACAWPVRTVMSGPSGGVIGAATLAERLGISEVVTLDIGGTSSDMGLIAGGRAHLISEGSVADAWPILAPMIDIVSIGAGGGSIAWLDEGGALRVGPQSAGADPAPVCYGRGGTEPTVTDANVVLGRLNPEYFLGGRMQLDVDGARGAIERIADAIGLSLEATAEGIVRIANANMSKAIRAIVLERGLDPRDFVLMGFGGGGGMHTAAVMVELGIPRGLVPANPGALSAIGMLVSDFRHDRVRTMVRGLEDVDLSELDTIFGDLAADASAPLLSEGFTAEAIDVQRSVDLRYVGQEYHLRIPCDGELSSAQMSDAFQAEHARVYGFTTPEAPVQLVNLRVAAIARTPSPSLPMAAARPAGSVLETDVRPVYFADDGWVDTTIVKVVDLSGGDVLEGPAVVEDPRSTMLVLPGQRAEVDELLNLHLLADGANR